MTTEVAPQKRYRAIVFTKNNPTVEGQVFLETLVSQLPVKYIAFQKEEGEDTHTPHFQGYAEFTRQVTHNNLTQSLLHGAHWETRRGTPQQAATYATKEDTRVDGPWIYGTISEPGKRNDIIDTLATARSEGIRQAALQHPETYVRNARGIERVLNLTAHRSIRDVHVTLLYGPAGVGKSNYVWTTEGTDNLSTVESDLKWFDDYMGQSALFIDEFLGSKSNANTGFLNKVLDRYPLKLPTKGGFTSAQYVRVYIATNIHPKYWFDWFNTPIYPAFVRRINMVLEWNFDSREPRAPDVIMKKGEHDTELNKFFY